jgi:hypothetical protein
LSETDLNLGDFWKLGYSCTSGRIRGILEDLLMLGILKKTGVGRDSPAVAADARNGTCDFLVTGLRSCSVTGTTAAGNVGERGLSNPLSELPKRLIAQGHHSSSESESNRLLNLVGADGLTFVDVDGAGGGWSSSNPNALLTTGNLLFLPVLALYEFAATGAGLTRLSWALALASEAMNWVVLCRLDWIPDKAVSLLKSR